MQVFLACGAFVWLAVLLLSNMQLALAVFVLFVDLVVDRRRRRARAVFTRRFFTTAEYFSSMHVAWNGELSDAAS